MILYHVDRLNSLQVGQNVQTSYPPMPTHALEKALEELYPDGLSRHGISYLVDPDKRMYINTNIEQIFELYRQLYFPDKPSRFQSFSVLLRLNRRPSFIVKILINTTKRRF